MVDNAYGREGNLLRVLFRDEQRKIVKEILASALEEAELAYRQLYYNRAPLMRFLRALNFPPVKAFQAAAEVTLNADFRRSIEGEDIDLDRSKAILDETEEIGVTLDATAAEFALRRKLETMADEFRSDPSNLSLLQRLDAAVQLAKSVPFHVQFWRVQNKYFEVLRDYYPRFRSSKTPGTDAETWLDSFRRLGDKLSFQIDRTD